jgi:hypothetical protein
MQLRKGIRGPNADPARLGAGGSSVGGETHHLGRCVRSCSPILRADNERLSISSAKIALCGTNAWVAVEKPGHVVLLKGYGRDPASGSLIQSNIQCGRYCTTTEMLHDA